MLLCILFVLGTHPTKTKLIFLSNLRDDLQEILKRSHEVQSALLQKSFPNENFSHCCTAQKALPFIETGANYKQQFSFSTLANEHPLKNLPKMVPINLQERKGKPRIKNMNKTCTNFQCF